MIQPIINVDLLAANILFAWVGQVPYIGEVVLHRIPYDGTTDELLGSRKDWTTCTIAGGKEDYHLAAYDNIPLLFILQLFVSLIVMLMQAPF